MFSDSPWPLAGGNLIKSISFNSSFRKRQFIAFYGANAAILRFPNGIKLPESATFEVIYLFIYSYFSI